MIHGLAFHHFNGVDRLPAGLLDGLERAMPVTFSHDALKEAFLETTRCFFDVALAFEKGRHVSIVGGLKESMDAFIELSFGCYFF